ncbi:hypothetical protein SCLCIDRAFT_488333 [Scleroderma citrinum Foug A]|uniref:Uncharacterized protein n=1 Tax=Scleroderma citrinum Foug A TaxID=1036808 RepID=A0A0C2YSQ3_9AGAM|nr:hypothetical protein SCLCIDRAFT_488333 [Scleroderma citrinum Foug A]
MKNGISKFLRMVIDSQRLFSPRPFRLQMSSSRLKIRICENGRFEVGFVAVVTDIAADGTMRGQCFSSECEHENACDTFEGGILSIEFQDAQPLRQLQWTVFHDG